MSAARHLRMNLVEIITIGANFTPSPQAVVVAPGTEIEFVNNTGFTINITFNPNPPNPPPPPAQLLFSNTPNIAPGGNNTQAPLCANGSTNYMVNVVGGASYGPFAIQVGNGPLYVQVSYVNSEVLCDPGEVMIPIGGTLQMVNTDSNSYSIGWGVVTNPFNPPLTTVGGVSGNIVHQSIAPAGTYTYTAGKSMHHLVAGHGGGRIVITN